MKLSDHGVYFIAAHEGVVPAPYLDSVGVWTYGIGHAETSGLPPNPRLMAHGEPSNLEVELMRAFKVFSQDIEGYSEEVRKAIKVNVTQNEFDAAVSFHYNTGAISRANWVKSLNEGDRLSAAVEIMNWSKPPEIISRRQAEQKLFRDGDYGNRKVTVFGVTKNNRPDFSRVLRRMSVQDVMRILGRYAQPEKTGIMKIILDFLKGLKK